MATRTLLACVLRLLAVATCQDTALPQSSGIFSLVGSTTTTLRDLNGGRQCIGPRGSRPPGWKLDGAISLSSCARIAAAQTAVVGFRYGTSLGYDTQVYSTLLRGQASDPVLLSQLFPGTSTFTCAIYMILPDGSTPDLQGEAGENLTALYQVTPVKASEGGGGAERRLKARTATHHVAMVGGSGVSGVEESDSLSDFAGPFVCRQRWSVASFFQPSSSELWFCYTLTTDVPKCNDALGQLNNLEGKVFAGVFLVLLAVLSYILRYQHPMRLALYWLASFMLDFELAFLLISSLVRNGYDAVTVRGCALLLSALGTPVILCPTLLGDNFCAAATMFALIVFSFSPIVVVQQFTMWPAYPAIIANNPLLIGLLAFLFQVGLNLVRLFALEHNDPARDGFELVFGRPLYDWHKPEAILSKPSNSVSTAPVTFPARATELPVSHYSTYY